jgi:hypothetical protein
MHSLQPPPPFLLLFGFIVQACTPSLPPTASPPSNEPDALAALSSGEDGGGDDEATYVAAWDAGSGSDEDATSYVPASTDAASAPAPPVFEGGCTQPLQPGNLVIDELMLESVAGAGDDGEWLEVASTAACAVNLSGLHGECAVGAKVYSFDVADDVWLEPGATFVVADSLDPAVNHYLPGLVLAWSGHPGDVLRNEGGTVTLTSGGELVVSLTWPSLKPVVGTSIEFPADCPAGDVDDFDDWEDAVASFFPGFQGTPNAPNLDVSCP